MSITDTMASQVASDILREFGITVTAGLDEDVYGKLHTMLQIAALQGMTYGYEDGVQHVLKQLDMLKDKPH